MYIAIPGARADFIDRGMTFGTVTAMDQEGGPGSRDSPRGGLADAVRRARDQTNFAAHQTSRLLEKLQHDAEHDNQLRMLQGLRLSG